MNVQTEKASRRKRKSIPRRVPAMIESRPRKPLIFGWGSQLTNREREAVKERIALFGGIALGLVLAALLGWGWYQDNIAGPANIARQNNTPVAQVGNYTITMGFFKRFENLQKNQLNNQISTLQQQINSLPAKNTPQKVQLQSQLAQLQQQLGTLPRDALTLAIDDQTMLQRASTAGVRITPQDYNTAINQLKHQAGGPRHFQSFLQSSGMSYNEIRWLATADYIRPKIQAKLAATVSHVTTKVRASHILVGNNKALAEKLLAEIKHGANFAALAKKYSKDPGSAKKGGDLGYFGRGVMLPQFEAAAYSMKIGQVRLVHTSYGWHIIKLTGREQARMTPTEYQQAQQNAFVGWLQKEEALLHVQRYVSPQNLPGASQAAASSSPLTNPVSQAPAAPAQQLPAGQVPVTVKSNKKASPTKNTSKKP